jgi:hypothetical protein
MISRLLRKLRIKSFPSGVEGSVGALSPQERATALIHAIDYCIKLRRDSPDIGTLISMALLQPGNLSLQECENLYFNLEGLCLQMKAARIPEAEYETVLGRHGKHFADNYRKTTELTWALSAIGLAILMTRLSYRMTRLQAKVNLLYTADSPYTRIGVLLRHSLPHIRVAAESHNKIASLTTPENAWSKEAMEFVENSASNIAMSYPS